MSEQLSLFPVPYVSGRLALRDEGGELVRVDMYTDEGSALSVDVPRERLTYYAKLMLEAGLRR